MTDFVDIPTDAAPEEGKPFTGEENLADNEKIVSWVAERANAHFLRYREALDEWWDEVGSVADFMYRCAENDSTRQGNQSDDTQAQTGTSLFFRQVRVLASALVAVMLSRKVPFKYVPVFSSGSFLKAEEGNQMADQQNLLAQWTLNRDDWATKIIHLAWSLIKYGNVPVTVQFKRNKQKRKVRVPKRDKEGRVISYDKKDVNVFVDNHPSFQIIPNENFFTDPTGGCLQSKASIIVRSFVTLSDLYAGQRNGDFCNVDKVTKDHLYMNTEEQERDDKRENMNRSTASDLITGEFPLYDVWIRIPIDDKGKLDEKGTEPKWYLCTFCGNLGTGSNICLRVLRNPDPDDEVPYKMLHALPDDDDLLYHMGYSEANSSTFYEAMTVKNQAIDQKNQLINRPLKAIVGEVHVDDLTFNQKKIFWCDNQNSITDFALQNVFPDTVALLNYLEEDMNKTMGTDKPIVGEALGGRTSATEAQNIFEQAQKPGMILIKYVLQQLLPWYAHKSRRLWELYAHKDQVAEISGEPERRSVKPAELFGEFDVEIDLVDEFADNAMVIQGVQYLMTQIMSNPKAAEVLDFRELMMEILPRLKVTKNPARIIKPAKGYDSEMIAELENDMMLDPQNPEWVEPEASQPHDIHLLRHRSERDQYRLLPPDQQPAGLKMLEQHILLHEQLQGQSQGAGAVPPQKPPTPGLPGELSGDAIAGSIGEMTAAPEAGRPSIAEEAEAEQEEEIPV